jgi:thiamine biosynthesis lipoprotein
MMIFRAMNSDIAVIADREAVHAIRQTFVAAEQRFSRFRDDSELMQLNRATEPMIVSEPMFAALVAARHYVELTDGIFDPAIGATLVALGYDRSFEPGALDREHDRGTATAARFLDVELDATSREVTRPHDLQIDLCGMIKGRTVDEAAVWLARDGAIDAGGDAVMRGGGSNGWLVEVEDPRDPSCTLATIRVRDRAVATSAANYRRWQVAGTQRHHIVDPRTQRSAATDLLQVTVVAPTAELADVLAKTVFILGADHGRALIERHGDVGAVLIATDGSATTCGVVS